LGVYLFPFTSATKLHFFLGVFLHFFTGDDTALGGGIALGDVLAGLVHRRINASEAHDGAAAGKAAHITDLRH